MSTAGRLRSTHLGFAVSRVVLIVNPYSSGVTRSRVAEVTAALARRAEVVVRQTERRGHAVELAAEAAGEADASSSSRATEPTTRRSTAPPGSFPFGFIPGGGASVFPRALGLPRDPVAAAAQAVEALDAGRTSSIALGRVNGRRFCFSAGIGLDAEAVRRIDRRGRDGDGRRAGNAVFAATVIGIMVENRLRMPAQLEIEGFGRAAFVFVANGRPYTYIGPIPVTIAGRAEFAGGLDFVAPRAVSPAAVAGAGSARLPRHARRRSARPDRRTTSTRSTSAAIGRYRCRPTARTSAT